MPLKKYTNNQKKMIKRHIKYKVKQTGIEEKRKLNFNKTEMNKEND